MKQVTAILIGAGLREGEAYASCEGSFAGVSCVM